MLTNVVSSPPAVLDRELARYAFNRMLDVSIWIDSGELRWKRLGAASMRGTAGPIRTVAKLSRALGLSESFLREVAERSDSESYRPTDAPPKKDGQKREVFSPSRDVRLIQGRIVARILKRPAVVRWPPYIFGGIHRDALAAGDKRDHVECARMHCGARSLLKMDITDFFGNVSEEIVFRMFVSHFGWGAGPAKLLAKLCCRDGRLPQGGITSSYLALMSLYNIEPQYVGILASKKLVYTRYVDDITVSSKLANYEFSPVRALIGQALLVNGFSINEAKTVITRTGLEPLVVHGLNVSQSSPTLPRVEVKRVKAIGRQTVMDAVESGRRSYSFRKRYYRAMGLVNKLSRVRSRSHEGLLKKLKSVRPLPSFEDYKIATDSSYELRDVYSRKKSGYWYFRRFNKLMARLDLIATENELWALNLRRYMTRHYRPEFKESL
ncbi:RNA-directed DNA polymerase [Stenotrophomonas rhizophila]|uniref:RNA-directed DNA polymerase n=1 Tax=Stenotrophomonas rhizophila TaxID=216778 RepID=A0AAP5AL27_9GAMM|nr:reverse transcriptase family protein [Stenotrophomonas rhizophila]MDQ1110046.1 RNA-directed DNA polymerase [Stenotrophomonas rhizophila]